MFATPHHEEKHISDMSAEGDLGGTFAMFTPEIVKVIYSVDILWWRLPANTDKKNRDKNICAQQ